MNKFRIFLFVPLISLLLTSTSFAQGFPWNDFKRRTFKQIVSFDEREIQASETQNRVIFHADMLLSVIRVKYEGKSRPLAQAKQIFLLNWAQTFAGNAQEYASNYKNDFLFTEDGVEYWLPVQNKVSAYFAKELREGDELDVYIVRAGGVCSKKVCDWLFLVEEFQKPKAASAN